MERRRFVHLAGPASASAIFPGEMLTPLTPPRDTGQPLVVINHGASEETGVRMLAEQLEKTYPEQKVIHYGQGCGYEWVTG
jgi:hypothetical protein